MLRFDKLEAIKGDDYANALFADFQAVLAFAMETAAALDKKDKNAHACKKLAKVIEGFKVGKISAIIETR